LYKEKYYKNTSDSLQNIIIQPRHSMLMLKLGLLNDENAHVESAKKTGRASPLMLK